jgi:hypothetical protein
LTRSELEHLIRAAGDISRDSQIVVIGSQSILGSIATPPPALTVSMEADLYPMNSPERADDIDGAIGEGSLFHEEFGYYAQGVGPETATLPKGWRERLVSLKNANTRGVEGLCLEPHDLAISKYVAGREKDLTFTAELARHKLTRRDVLLKRLRETSLEASLATIVGARIERDFRAKGRPRR